MMEEELATFLEKIKKGYGRFARLLAPEYEDEDELRTATLDDLLVLGVKKAAAAIILQSVPGETWLEAAHSMYA